MNRMRAAAAGAVVWVLAAAPAQAHLRNYIFSQDYYTTTQGEVEVELYNDYDFSDLDNGDTHDSKHQLELEYGLTDHLQIALYDVYTWDAARADEWQRDMWKAELKYRLAEVGQWPVDVTLYTEYKAPNGPRDRRSDAWENKLILAKHVGPVHLVTNLIAEKDLNTHGDWTFEYTAGISHAFTPRITGFLEYKEELGGSHDVEWFAGHHKQQLLPGVAVTFTPHVRLLAGPAFGLTSPTDDLQVKSILEVEF